MASRQQLLEEIASEARLTARQTGRSEFSKAVMGAMGRVPREAFVPGELAERAYENRPLPIGEGQTISQPFIVALMTELLDPQRDHRVLEIGTGCGYQAAILAELFGEVYSIETRSELGEDATARLAELGYGNVNVRIDDGRSGWPEAAPFEGIIVTAAAEEIPDTLLEQLARGGRMAIPVSRGTGQQLELVSRNADGQLDTRSVLPVAFVPLS